MPRKPNEKPKHAGDASNSRRWFNVVHAADYCDSTNTWIEDRRRDGSLPYRQIGDHTVFDREDLDALIESFPVQRGFVNKQTPAFAPKESNRRAA